MADNTASNLGTGQGIFSGKVADDLQFKSLKAGTNVTLSSDANEITINSSGTVSTGLNLGSGEGLYVSVSTGALQLKSLIGGAGIALSNTGTEITIAADSANLNAGTLGGLASSAFLTKTDNLASVADIPTSRTNLGVYSKTEADNKFQIKAGNIMPDADNTRSIGDNSNRYSDVYATELHGTATRAGVVTSISTHDIESLQNVDGTGKASGHVLKYNGSHWVSTVDGGATNIGALTDVDTSGIANGQILKFNSSTSKFEAADDSGAGGGSSTFVGLSDTPNNYSGAASKFVKANSAGNGIEFVADPGYITDLSSFDTGNLTEGSNLYYTNARADARIGAASINALSDVDTSGAAAGKILKYNGTTWVIADESTLADTDALSEGSTNLYFTNARADARISAASINALTDVNTSGITSGQVLSWNGASFVASSAGTGDITRVNITAGTGLTGTQDTTSGDHTQTLAVDVGTTAGKIVQLDGTGKLPAVDGSQLTGVSTTTSFVGLTDTPSNFTGGASKFVKVNAAENALEYVADPGYLTSVPAQSFASLTGKPTTIAGYGITDAFDGVFGSLSGKPTTIAGYGITDAFSGAYADLTGKPTLFDNSAFDTRLSAKTTDDLSEGSTNLYFTNARADARIAAAGINALSDVDTTGIANDKILKYNSSTNKWEMADDQTGGGGSATFVGLSDTPGNFSGASSRFVKVNAGGNALEFVADPGYLTSVPAQSFASLTGKPTTIAGYGITDAFDNSAFDTRLATKDTGDVAEGSNLYFTDARARGSVSVTTGAASGGGTLSYNNGTGAFTFAPADLSGYQTTAGLNAAIDSHLNQSNPTSGYVLSWNGSDYAWVTNAGYTNTDFDNRLATKTTDNLSEGSTNLYYTDARSYTAFDTRLATKDTDALSEGSSNLYFTNARADARIAAATYGFDQSSATGTYTINNTAGAVLASLSAGTTTTVGGITLIGKNYTGYGEILNENLAKLTENQANTTSPSGALTGQLWYDSGNSLLKVYNGTSWVTLASTSDIPADTDALSEGSTNLYFTNARSRSAISLGSAGSQAYNSGTGVLTVPGTTDHITEGSNLFYTDARADARVQAVIIDEDNMASDDNTKVPTQQSVKAYVDSQVASENELSEMNDVAIASVQNNDFLKYNTSTAKWENASVSAATAAGSDTQVQFNDGGVMGADAGFTYNKSTDAITVGSVTTTGASPQISAAGGLTIETTASNGNITITPHNTGEIILDGQKWPQADGSANQYLKTDGAGQLSYDSLTTDDVSEGANQYYTDARARAAISEGSAQLSYNSSTGVLTFTQDNTDGITEGSTNLYYTDARANSAFDTRLATKDTDDLSEGSTNQYFTNARAVSAVQGVNLDMGSNNITTLGKIYFKNLFSAEADLPSASTYHGMFAHVHATGAAYFAHGGAWVKLANNSQLANSANWDTSYGWGDHGAAGYLTSVPAQSFASLTGKPTTIAGYGITDAFDNSDFDTRLATKDTGDVAEGSNLYYTNARADARIAAAGLTTLSDVDAVVAGDDGKVLYYDHSSTSFKWKTDATGGGTLNTAGNTGTGSVTLASETLQVLGTSGQINVDAAGFALSLSLDQNINSIQSIAFEGSTADANEIKLTVTDPTTDRTITMPDATGYLPVFTTSSPAAITDGTSGQALVTDGNGQLSFTTISGGSSLTVQDEGSSLSTAATTLNFVGAGVVASGTGATKTITIAGGGGSGGTTYEEFKINYSTAGQVQSISDTSSGISSVNIDSAAGGDLTVNFTGYTTPPLSFTMYGYNYAANKYNYNSAASGNMTLRELPGGGSSGSPTAFGSFSNMQIRCSESETGASRSFGTVTHAWVRFVMAV